MRLLRLSRLLPTILTLTWALLAGCGAPVIFPEHAVRVTLEPDGGRALAYDTPYVNGTDYEEVWGPDGRVRELRYLADTAAPGLVVRLDQVDPAEGPHFVIALDGVPFEILQELRAAGHFRLFGEPARVVSCFPSATDVAFARMFGGAKPLSYEAEYYDRAANRVISGTGVYLSGENADWARDFDYRTSLLNDAFAYMRPGTVFRAELRGMHKAFSQRRSGQGRAYLVGTAGLATREGREGIIKFMRKIDRYCQQLFHQHRGRVAITLVADHGHSLTPCRRIDFDPILESGGYRHTNRLQWRDDVVIIDYGLVTYAAMHTDDPEGVAGVLLGDPRVTLAFWPADDAIMCADLAGRARIQHRPGYYRYEPLSGDPLQLADILADLRTAGHIDADGWVADEVLFAATADHIYPDAVKRLWEAFHGLVRYPADLLVCLADGWCNGSAGFAMMIGETTSTHGQLNYRESITIAMTTLGDLPPALRLEDVMPAVERLQSPATD